MRNDIHKPSLVRPEDYTYVGIIYQGASEEAWEGITEHGRDPEFKAAVEALEKAPFDGNHKLKGTCDHCGAWFAYGMVYKHQPTGEHICVGHTCSHKTIGCSSRQDLELKRLKSRIKAQRELMALREHAATFLEQHCPDLATTLGFDAEPKHHILQNMHERFWNRCPALSDPQIELARKLRDEVVEREEKAAAEPPLEPVVTGKVVEIKGEVLCTKWQDNNFGGALKMLVMDDRRFKVWGTVPSSIDPERGSRVQFVAQVESSDDEETFGFFKRPRKAILETEHE